MALRKSRRRSNTKGSQTHPRRKGNLFAIDSDAVSEAREFGSREFSAEFSVGSFESHTGFSDIEDESEAFLCDSFAALSFSRQRPGSGIGILVKKDDNARTGRKRPRHTVSFAEHIESVHIVDNLKLCLTQDEKSSLWPTSPPEIFSQQHSQDISPLDLPLYEAGYMGDEPLSPGRKDMKRRRRKTQSKLRNAKHFSPSATALEISQRHVGKKKVPLSPMISPLRSLTARLGFRNRERMQSGILVPIRD
eukprot:CAMPEP_0197184342 /NCGR_PEP_ID=MMETSP1423-20130617/9678_1 /TAXON_ID=476441 /ORGANISM="Pseudo-nitzschia heimii, Strain UNC1101" /LENGTH=248 /DNA_ID=CAMNT_0042635135 /DNA_START=43 /DNA_END=789 /DNA_ORIENTATION=+